MRLPFTAKLEACFNVNPIQHAGGERREKMLINQWVRNTGMALACSSLARGQVVAYWSPDAWERVT
jgi:hypothetical protein